MSKFIANGSDIPSDFDIAKHKANQLLASIDADKKAEARQEVIEQNPEKAQDFDYDDDFDKARANMKKILVVSEEALNDFYEMAQSSESPRAFEVLNQMIKTASDLNKDLMDLHSDKLKRKKAQKEIGGDLLPEGTTITQNNYNLTPAEALAQLKQDVPSDDIKDV